MNNQFDLSKFEERLRFFMQNQGITYAEIARGCNIPVSYVVENLREDVQDSTILEHLYEKYAVNKNWLLTGKGVPYITAAVVEVDEAFLKNVIVKKIMRMRKHELISIRNFIEKNMPWR